MSAKSHDQQVKADRRVHKRLSFVHGRLLLVMDSEHQHLTGPEYDKLVQAGQLIDQVMERLVPYWGKNETEP